MVNKTINFLPKSTKDLKIFNPKALKFYITLKIHKENNSGGPEIPSTVTLLKYCTLKTITLTHYRITKTQMTSSKRSIT